jgi:hypothetical protein
MLALSEEELESRAGAASSITAVGPAPGVGSPRREFSAPKYFVVRDPIDVPLAGAGGTSIGHRIVTE